MVEATKRDRLVGRMYVLHRKRSLLSTHLSQTIPLRILPHCHHSSSHRNPSIQLLFVQHPISHHISIVFGDTDTDTRHRPDIALAWLGSAARHAVLPLCLATTHRERGLAGSVSFGEDAESDAR